MAVVQKERAGVLEANREIGFIIIISAAVEAKFTLTTALIISDVMQKGTCKWILKKLLIEQ